MVSAVAQHLVCPQSVERRAVRLPRDNGFKVLLRGTAVQDLRVSEMRHYVIILHTVVFVDRECEAFLFGVAALVDKLRGGGNDRVALIYPVQLRIVQTSAYGESRVRFLRGQRRRHIVVAVKAGIAHFNSGDAEHGQHSGYDVLYKSRDIAVRSGIAVRQVVVEISYRQRIVGVEPFLFRCRERPARNAYGVVFRAQGIDIVRLIDTQFRLCRVQLVKKVGSCFVHADIVVRCADSTHDLGVFASGRTVALRGDDIDLSRAESRDKSVIARISDKCSVDAVRVKIRLCRSRDRAVESAYPFPAEGSRHGGYIRVRRVLDEAVHLVSHRLVRVADKPGAVFSERKTGEKVYFSVQELFVHLGEIAVNIFVAPARVFRYFPVVFVGISGLDGVFRRALLEHLVFVVADPYCLRIRLGGGAHGKTCCRGERYAQKRQQTYCFFV